MPGPVVTADRAELSIPDPDRRWDAVRLEVDWVCDSPRAFALTDGCWTLTLPRPAAWRLEYRLSLHRDGQQEWIADPTNPRQVGNPFGVRSELRFPDYREPAWLLTPPGGDVRPISAPRVAGAPALGVAVRLWTPDGLDPTTAAPLLLVHDGSDLADRGGLLSWATARSRVAPLRIALLDPAPGRRQDQYAADPAYADHLADAVIPALTSTVATSTVVGLGASLGALAWLYLHRRHPDAVDALALQSGSFFTRELDAQESGWAPFDRICDEVVAMSRPVPDGRVIPLLMTCGAIEENLANNRALAAALVDQGYPVELIVNPDAHTTVGWRDVWFPALDELLTDHS
ncbi:alpha/beta hydrolase [Micromonospora sp.]|uniref:alpha/beta hydrolase n=1 Tax=Micromonospora sp. TaxID=1876 RepID=UPI003B3A112D